MLALALLIPPLVLFMVWGNWLVGGTGPSGSMFGPAVATICLFTVLNAGLKRWRPRWSFTAAELVTIYVVVAIGAGMISSVWDWSGALAPVIAFPAWQANSANHWAETVLPNMAPWLIVSDKSVLEGFFLGNSTAYRLDVLRAWATPALWWTAWTVGLTWVTLCSNVIVRRRWSEQEKLPFPMTELPLRMVEPGGGLFRDPFWWGGVVISSAIGVLIILSAFFPSVPTVPLGIDLSAYINNNHPWDALRNWRLSWGPWGIGISYLMPVDMAFSLIVFNLMWRAEYVLSRLFGWNVSSYSGFPYGDQQIVGAFLAMMAVVIWLDRRYLLQVLRRACGLRSLADDRGEAFSYRTAVFGGAIGFGFLCWFLARGGMSHGLAVCFLVLYFLMVMAMSRVRAQLGPPEHEMLGVMPEYALTQFPGTRAISPRALGMIALLRPYMNEQRPNPCPTQIEGLRLAERLGASQKKLAWIMIAVVPFAMFFYFWANLGIGYHQGLEAKGYRDLLIVCNQAAGKLDGWLRNPTGPNWSGTGAIGIGALVTVALMAAKLQFSWWPLHPIAFPLALSYPIDGMTPAIIASLTVKSLLLRYGGLRAHRKALPFFLGLIAGSATTALVQILLLRSMGMQ